MTSGRSGGVDRDLYISEKMPSVSVKDVDQQKFIDDHILVFESLSVCEFNLG